MQSRSGGLKLSSSVSTKLCESLLLSSRARGMLGTDARKRRAWMVFENVVLSFYLLHPLQTKRARRSRRMNVSVFRRRRSFTITPVPIVMLYKLHRAIFEQSFVFIVLTSCACSLKYPPIVSSSIVTARSPKLCCRALKARYLLELPAAGIPRSR